MHMTTNGRISSHAAVILSVCVMMAGCSMFSGGPTLYKGAKGAVYLEDVVDWSYEASHPAAIDQMTLQKILRGLYADESLSPASRMPVAGGKPMRIFSDEEAAFLAPLLAQGLSQAKPEQIVGFTLPSSTGSGAEPTAGTIYIHQGTVHATIAPSSAIKAAGFMPSSLARLEKAPSYAAGGSNDAMSLVIDYQALAKAPMPQSMAVMAKPAFTPPSTIEPAPKPAALKQESIASASVRVIPVNEPIPAKAEPVMLSNDEMLNKKLDELQKAREVNEAKSTEIKVLRKELAWMKRELRERTDEIKAMQTKVASRKPAPKKKTAEARPIQ